MSDKIYSATVGYHTIEADIEKYQMTCSTDMSLEAFMSCVKELSDTGYQITPAAQNDSIVGFWAKKGDDRKYLYYTVRAKEARFITDRGDAVDLDQFSYRYEKKNGDTTTFYSYGLAMHPDGINVGETYPDASKTAFYEKYPELLKYANAGRMFSYKNCGAMQVLKLADNSVMIIDGGAFHQMSVEAGEHLNKFLHNITDTPLGEKVRICCWYITHPHGDHYTAFGRFLVNLHQQYVIERIMYNFDRAEADKDPKLYSFLGAEYLKKYYPDIIFHRQHTGETIQLADVTFDVLFTPEDLVNPETMQCEYKDGNSTSTFLRTHIDGQTVAIIGDFAEEAAKVLLQNYDESDLKMDILEVPHHGWNNIPSLFNAVNPTYSFFGQSSGGAVKGLRGKAERTYNSVVEATRGGASNLFFAGDETVGFTVVNGKFQVTFREPTISYAWDGSNGGRETRWDYFDLFQ